MDSIHPCDHHMGEDKIPLETHYCIFCDEEFGPYNRHDAEYQCEGCRQIYTILESGVLGLYASDYHSFYDGPEYISNHERLRLINTPYCMRCGEPFIKYGYKDKVYTCSSCGEEYPIMDIGRLGLAESRFNFFLDQDGFRFTGTHEKLVPMDYQYCMCCSEPIPEYNYKDAVYECACSEEYCILKCGLLGITESRYNFFMDQDTDSSNDNFWGNEESDDDEELSWAVRESLEARIPMSEDHIKSIPIVALEEGSECAICLQSFQKGQDVKKLYCNHCFDVECIDEWLRIQASCPVCRIQMYE